MTSHTLSREGGKPGSREAARSSKGKAKLHPSMRRKFSITRAVDILAQDVGLPKYLRKSLTGAIRARDADLLKRFCDTFGSPLLYRDPDVYFRFASVIALFKKCEDLQSKSARDVAVKKFLDGERRCGITNRKFADLTNFDFPTLQVLERASVWIAEVLGNISVREVANNARHGPGASLGVGGRHTTEIFKWWNTPYTIPGNAVSLMQEILADNPLACRDWQVSNFNRVTYVPKSIFTLRSIAIETTLGMYGQQGVGEAMRCRMLPFGIDIRNQKANRWLARYASLTGEYATIDLANASGTIALLLVRFLFGRRMGGFSHVWLDMMERLRSPTYTDGTRNFTYNMFSSMGNGYTFPLETIIFAAIIEGVRDLLDHPSPYVVYGDDILVHTEIAPFVIAIFESIGFTTNLDKTFLKGPFRESCGADYWDGEDVRPFFLNKIPSNSMELYSGFNTMFKTHRPEYSNLMDYFFETADEKHRFEGPEMPDTTDGYFFSETAKARWLPYRAPILPRQNKNGDLVSGTPARDAGWYVRGIKTHTPDLRERAGEGMMELLYHHALRGDSRLAPVEINIRDLSLCSEGWFRLDAAKCCDLEPKVDLVKAPALAKYFPGR